MKAKVISTGEIVELNDEVSFIDYARGIHKDKDGKEYRYNELEFIEENDEKPIDWERCRYEIAKEVFLYRLKSSPLTNYKDDAKDAVIFADALINELKKGGMQ